jgi:hypothetical protein
MTSSCHQDVQVGSPKEEQRAARRPSLELAISRDPEHLRDSCARGHVHAISMPSACHQQSTAISGNARCIAPTRSLRTWAPFISNQRSSAAVNVHQLQSASISRTHPHSPALSRTQSHSVALSRTQSHSVALTRAGRRHAHSPQQLDRRPLRKTKRPPRPRPPLPGLARRWGAVRGSWLIHLANEGQLGQ